jgi:hypothetical protein
MLSKDLVINDFYKGIADSPHLGFEDIRNFNFTSTPGAATINFKTSALSIPPTVSAASVTAVAATDIFTVASTTNWYNGMAVELGSLTGGTGASASRVYWVGDLSGATFKLYKNPALEAGSVLNITTDLTAGTVTSYTLNTPIDKAMSYATPNSVRPNYIFILDESGRVWWVKNSVGTLTSTLVYLGNDTLTGTTGRGINVYKDYLIVFRTSLVDALPLTALEDETDLDTSGGWTYAFETISTVTEQLRPTLVGQDDVLYYSNGAGRLASITEVSGSIFDPTSGATWTENVSAVRIPRGDYIQSLGELGTHILIGGIKEYVYPWDRVSPSFDYPILLPEHHTSRIVTSNQIAYLTIGAS